MVPTDDCFMRGGENEASKSDAWARANAGGGFENVSKWRKLEGDGDGNGDGSCQTYKDRDPFVWIGEVRK